MNQVSMISRLNDAGFPIGPHPDAACRHCHHLWGNHLVHASVTGDPLDGGHLTCPYVGCDCLQNWDLSAQQRQVAKEQRDAD